jgi:MFS family permease
MNNLTAGHQNRWRGLVFLCISLLVISLDNTVVNVALPSISKQLGGSDTDLQWIVAAYILVFAALLLTMGALGDRIGRKRVLQFGLLWFGAGSLLAALSPSTGMLILSRALLGVGGAMIMPSTLSIISATFLNQRERFQAIAIWGAMFGVGSALGPLVGGLLRSPKITRCVPSIFLASCCPSWDCSRSCTALFKQGSRAGATETPCWRLARRQCC